MLRHKMVTTFIYILFTIVLFACAKGTDGQRCRLAGNCPDGGATTVPQTTGPTTLSGSISCTAQSTKASFNHNETVGITISASGGSGVFSVPRFVSAFSGSTTIYIGAYQNSGSSERAVENTVTVLDSDGRVANCNFRFSVKPSTTPPVGTNSLACGITASKLNPMVGEAINFDINATGGSNSYTFELFYPRQGEAAKALATVSGGTAHVSHTYTWVGYADPTVKVKDSAGASVWCEIPQRYMQILPRSTPTLFVSVSASTIDADGYVTDSKNLYRVTLIPSGFSGTAAPTYRYTNSTGGTLVENGVSIKQNMNWTGASVFFIKREDAPTSHSFEMKFIAEAAGNQSATGSVNIQFGTTMACYVQDPVYIYQGVESTFNVGSYTGEALEIAETTAPANVTLRKAVNGNTGVLGVTFAAQGYYEIRFKARARLDALKYCNGKADYVYRAYIFPPPSTFTGCEVRPNLTSVSKDAPLRVDVLRKGGVVDMNGYDITLTPGGSHTWVRGPYANGADTSSIDLKLHEVKQYGISVTMRERSTGVTRYCSSQVEVVSAPGLLAKVYDIPTYANNAAYTNNALGRFSEWTHVAYLNHTVQNVSVSSRWSDCSIVNNTDPNCEYPGVYGRKEWFGVEYTGYIKAPVSGTYHFQFLVDDGISLEIDGTNILYFDGLHAPQYTPLQSRYLSAGDHTIRIRYFQGPKTLVANSFYWIKPGGIWQVVPSGTFRH